MFWVMRSTTHPDRNVLPCTVCAVCALAGRKGNCVRLMLQVGPCLEVAILQGVQSLLPLSFFLFLHFVQNVLAYWRTPCSALSALSMSAAILAETLCPNSKLMGISA